MEVQGKYWYEVYNADKTLYSKCEAKNLVVNNGLACVVDWLSSNSFATNYYPGLVKVDTTGMSVTNAGFTNPLNVIDGDPETYSTATISNASWDNVWWKIDMGAAKSIMAFYIDFCESDATYGADYKLQYSADNTNWYDFTARFRPPQEDYVRGKVLYYVSAPFPQFVPVTGVRYIRMNTKMGSTSQTFRFQELRIYTDNFFQQPPMVMGIGTSSTPTTSTDTAISGGFYKVVSNITQPSSNIARFIMDLLGTEANDVSYWEVGMFYNISNNYTLQTSSNATTLFSRAIFDTALIKTSGQTAQIVYELTVSSS